MFASWLLLGPAVAILGLAIGAASFFYVAPGPPAVGVIQIPFTPIDEGSALAIGRQLDYAQRDDAIKAVVIALSSPGGSASASERLYLQTRRLRETKPVVIVMNGMAASGGYMMGMGGNYIYAQPTSLVGNVGVVGMSGGLFPPLLPEIVTTTGPYKLTGGSRQHWVELIDLAKDAFAQIVIRERGARLQLSKAELLEGNLYSGSQALSLGLVDAIGETGDGVAKAAELAGIGRYRVVDVNAAALEEYALPGLPPAAPPAEGLSSFTDGPIQIARERGEVPLPNDWAGESAGPGAEFPIAVGRPNIYYLYAGYGY